MAINKKLIHFNAFETFNSKKLSANIENTLYTIGINGSVLTGSPDILYHSIVYIKDTKQQWTHGLLYDCTDLSDYATKEELNSKQDTITDLETIRQGAAKGETALLEELYKGTITGITMNGSSKGTSGIIDLGNVVTDVSNKQDILISGTNIKTINGNSILGEGNIDIEGDGEGSSSYGNAYPQINHGTSDTTFTLTPNTFHIWDEITFLDLDLGEEVAGVANEYLFQFNSGSELTTLILPEGIRFNSDFTIERHKIYQISILNRLGTVMSWEVASTQGGGITGGGFN